MKQFLNLRVLPVLLALSLILSLCVVPAAAADNFPSSMRDYDSVADWEAKLKPNSTFVATVAGLLNVNTDSSTVFWSLVNSVMGRVGPVSLNELTSIVMHYDGCFNKDFANSFFGQLVSGTIEFGNDCVALLLLGTPKLNFVVKRHPETNVQRIYEEVTGTWVVDSAGRYPYVEGPSDTAAGNQWVDLSRVLAQVNSGTLKIDVFSGQALMNLCANLVAADVQCRIMQISKEYKAICTNNGDFVYCNADGLPFVAFVDDDAWAVNQDREDTTVTDGEGNEVEGLPENNSSGIDLENMLIYLPNGSIGMIDNLTYDASSKTYNVDSHDVYNTYITYNYTYYINYTSITYIGQTEEYEKYEVYFELPDGRDSADLTKEEVEQLNISVDVIPYGRSTDNITLRSLYHFDGDTKDESYWNYCTEFIWNDGASLTYMDVGAFDGALYLDETSHDFDFVMPSGMGSSDLTLQWRMYSSHTLAPQIDSYVKFGDVKVAHFDGKNIYDGKSVSLDDYSIGVWNEFALIRDNGTLYYYVNGLCVGSWANTTPFEVIKFHFGDDQQTYKYFDELRVLNYALQDGGASYTPSSVPHDTNLALILPDESVPIADEYIEFTHTDNYYTFLDFSTGTMPENLKYSSTTPSRGTWGYSKAETYLAYSDRFVTIGEGVLRHHMFTLDEGDYTLSFGNGDAILTILFADGTSDTLVFDGNSVLDRVDFDWGYVSSGRSGSSPTFVHRLGITFTSSVDVVGIEIAPGTESNFSAELVSSVVIMTPDQIKTPTLAVKTDIEITGHQIGGVRPSVPEKGQVWAMIENQRITSLQIYNGQAWEAVDGRIWTGVRWIPPSSYNIITLQDMLDIVDATPGYEYIYTEAGFWSWWQKAWISFTEQLFSILTGGVGSPDCEHAYAVESQVEPTCTESGQITSLCSLCGDRQVEEVLPLGHDWRTVLNTEITGKNLFYRDYDASTTLNGVEIAYDPLYQEFILNGTVTANGDLKLAAPLSLDWTAGDLYTVSVHHTGGSAALASGSGIAFGYSIFSSDLKKYIRGSLNGSEFPEIYSFSGNGFDASSYVFYLQCWRVGTVFDNYRIRVQVEAGEAATAWEPGGEPPVDLPDSDVDIYYVCSRCGEISDRAYSQIQDESDFWDWWQQAWMEFVGSGGTGADGDLGDVDLDAEDPALLPEDEADKTFWQFILVLIVGGKSVVSGVRDLTAGAVSSVPDSMQTIVSAFDSGGLAMGAMDGSYTDPDAADLSQNDNGEAVLAGVEEVDPWRYR